MLSLPRLRWVVGLVVGAIVVGGAVEAFTHRGPHLYPWEYNPGHADVRWEGQLYRVTHTVVTARGKQVALWHSFGPHGGSWTVYAVRGVPDRDALVIQTTQGDVLAVRIGRAPPL